tara:strand:+ start:9697 stop:10464 length:768 start_codon:yes stop_codon:yes gene_type:complete
MKIHNTSIIHKDAIIGDNVEVGPYCIIDSNVKIGNNTKVLPYVHILSNTTIGENNIFHQGSTIGGLPQDLKYNDEYSELIIGDNNTIREYCTFNRGTEASGKTVIGSNCLFMAYVHIAHDCIVEDKVILANGVQLGGHSEIHYHATVGGMSPVHQFCKVGQHAFIGGGRVALQDVPPFILANGEPLKYAGINSIGLRRRNFDSDTRSLIKKAYKILYLSHLNRSQAIDEIKNTLELTNEIKTIIKFIENSDRGLI